jgi:hypothetical protein
MGARSRGRPTASKAAGVGPRHAGVAGATAMTRAVEGIAQRLEMIENMRRANQPRPNRENRVANRARRMPTGPKTS